MEEEIKEKKGFFKKLKERAVFLSKPPVFLVKSANNRLKMPIVNFFLLFLVESVIIGNRIR